MSDPRRGFGRLIESGRGVKRLIDFITADAARAIAADADKPTPKSGDTDRAPYSPTEEAPTMPDRSCPLDPPAGWRCVRAWPHLPEACELKRKGP